MGADKAFLKFQAKTLLERAVGVLKPVVDAVHICGPREKFGADAIEDIFPNCGPLGGIHAALKSSQSEWNFVLAVDLPFVKADFLRYLLSKTEVNSSGVKTCQGTASARPGTPRAVPESSAKIGALAPEVNVSLAVVPRASHGWQPLCALYHKALAETAEKALREKRYKIDALFNEVPILPVEEKEILQAGFSLTMFDNLNTPEDFRLAQQRHS